MRAGNDNDWEVKLDPPVNTLLPVGRGTSRGFTVATARVLELTLVTADERLIDAGAVRVLANR